MKKRERLGPLEKAVSRNKKREDKDPKKVKIGVPGGHPGQSRAKGMVPISRTRLILADSFIRSRSYLDLLRCFNRQFFSQAEADYYQEELRKAHELLGRIIHQTSERWDSVHLTKYHLTDN